MRCDVSIKLILINRNPQTFNGSRIRLPSPSQTFTPWVFACPNRSGDALTLNECPLCDDLFDPVFDSIWPVFKMVLILSEIRLFPICWGLLNDLKIYPPNANFSFFFMKLNNCSLIVKTLRVTYWLVLDKVSFSVGFPLVPKSRSSNLNTQSSDRRRMSSLPSRN